MYSGADTIIAQARLNRGETALDYTVPERPFYYSINAGDAIVYPPDPPKTYGTTALSEDAWKAWRDFLRAKVGFTQILENKYWQAAAEATIPIGKALTVAPFLLPQIHEFLIEIFLAVQKAPPGTTAMNLFSFIQSFMNANANNEEQFAKGFQALRLFMENPTLVAGLQPQQVAFANEKLAQLSLTAAGQDISQVTPTLTDSSLSTGTEQAGMPILIPIIGAVGIIAVALYIKKMKNKKEAK